MKTVFFLLLFVTQITFAQSDKKIKKDLMKSLYYLADDKLEGRRTGSSGEKMAYEFIINCFKKNNIGEATGINNYLQPFEVNDGLSVGEKTSLTVGNKNYKVNDPYFPMPYSKTGALEIKNINEMALFYDIKLLIEDNATSPHFDLEEELYQKVKIISETQSAKIIFIFNSTDSAFELKFDAKNKRTSLPIMVIFCDKKIVPELKNSISKQDPLKINIEINSNIRTGHNVVGIINNNAPLTIIVGAHYDHLGYGEDHNSLYVGKEPMIHNGADDNASGTAALISLSKIIKQSGSKNFNYLFVAFSGEELGLYGSKYFTEHSPVDFKSVNYMINMDMVGRLNDSTHGITIGGFGTSPAWGNLIHSNDAYFKIKVDSAGSGPSDHTSFYRKDLPVLFFFTGTHSDYHKPSDDAEKINFDGEVKIVRYIQALVKKTASMDKLVFTKTREAASTGKSSFKVTMGIMPDYTFSGNGVLVDGVSDNRPAQKAGIKTGDVIYQLGDYIVSDVQTYMQALNKFNKGNSVKVKIKRGIEDLEYNIVF